MFAAINVRYTLNKLVILPIIFRMLLVGSDEHRRAYGGCG